MKLIQWCISNTGACQTQEVIIHFCQTSVKLLSGCNLEHHISPETHTNLTGKHPPVHKAEFLFGLEKEGGYDNSFPHSKQEYVIDNKNSFNSESAIHKLHIKKGFLRTVKRCRVSPHLLNYPCLSAGLIIPGWLPCAWLIVQCQNRLLQAHCVSQLHAPQHYSALRWHWAPRRTTPLPVSTQLQLQ